ncbi:HAD-IIIA family hydrolase [Dyadobacter sp. CY356]|uniref:D-glycero-alpha-D-manno-heptose-1,7-bisphosphate 7-phosphatase n=1 Tax=Dyadobacter sp. CY356 TaxID=2906442 RepID=UPI001F43AD07|nr:HAD family hydrolase [Dyadobacter sp. CY356]MCF0055043.1 HAD family hydrolase [Dyadobacter sp. CY356]
MSYADTAFQKAVFLDKDGTLIKDVPYNIDPALVVFEQGVFDGLRSLQDCGYKLIIISNQPGISLGYFSECELSNLIHYFEEKFVENNVLLSGFYYCPHLPEKSHSACRCRKPRPGMIMQAAQDLAIDLKSSWMIGDILNDVEAGNRAGCQTILIDNGNETEWVSGLYREPDYITRNFPDAAYITSRTVIKDGKQ